MDEDFIRRARSGDHSAFAALVERHSDAVWRLARVFMRTRGAADDAAQDAWIDVWRGLHTFDSRREFRPWLLTIAANRCRMNLRRDEPTVDLEEARTVAAGAQEDPMERAISGEVDAQLHALVARLPLEQRRLIALRYFAELDLAEVAAVMDLPLGTVKSRIHRTLVALRSALDSSTASDLLREANHE